MHLDEFDQIDTCSGYVLIVLATAPVAAGDDVCLRVIIRGDCMPQSPINFNSATRGTFQVRLHFSHLIGVKSQKLICRGMSPLLSCISQIDGKWPLDLHFISVSL